MEIEVYVKNDCWCIWISNPAISKLFGGNELPTCYKSTLKPDSIKKFVEKAFSGYLVTVDDTVLMSA